MFIRMHKRICSRIGLAMLLMMFVWMVSMTVAQTVIIAVDLSLLENPWVMWILNDAPLYLFGLPVFLLVLKGVPNGPVAPREKVRIGPGRYFMALVFGLGATYFFNLIMTGIIIGLQTLITGQPGTGNNALSQMVLGSGFLPTFLFGVCVPALGEEFIFRYMLRKKMNGCADITYMLFSSLCFALFHMNAVQGPYAFVLGMVFAWLYLVTDNIWLPVSLHFLTNLTGTALMPALVETPVGNVVAMLLMLGLVVAAIVIFVRSIRKLRATLRPPTEPGWYYKPPRRRAVQGDYAVLPQAYAAPSAMPSYTPYANALVTDYDAPQMQAPPMPAPHPQPGYAPAPPLASEQPFRPQPGYAPQMAAPPPHLAQQAAAYPAYPPAYMPPYPPAFPPPAAPRRYREPSNLGYSLRNAGSILYLVMAGLMTAITLATTLFMLV